MIDWAKPRGWTGDARRASGGARGISQAEQAARQRRVADSSGGFPPSFPFSCSTLYPILLHGFHYLSPDPPYPSAPSAKVKRSPPVWHGVHLGGRSPRPAPPRVLDVATTDLRAQTVRTVTYQIDADFTLVSAGHVSAGAAYVWGSFFADVSLYLFVGLGGAIFGAALIASEVSSGSIFILLSRPLSRQRVLLTKYGVAAGLLLMLCVLCGGLALLLGRWQGVELSVGGVLLSMLLLWLAVLFVLSLTLLYSVLVPSALAAGFLGFFTFSPARRPLPKGRGSAPSPLLSGTLLGCSGPLLASRANGATAP
jgi:hypothetical protein